MYYSRDTIKRKCVTRLAPWMNIPLYSYSLLFFFFLLSVRSGRLSPYTLINTEVECAAKEDCLAHYNNSWCHSGVRCIRNFCRLIPNFPCASTQLCREVEKWCDERKCTQDSECDNGLYCDGTEVCRENRCVTDPERPNCYYKGGRCNESLKECMQPKARIAWREVANNERVMLSLGTAMMTTNASIVTQLQVYESAVITIGAFIFVVMLLAIVYHVSRSVLMGRVTKKRRPATPSM
jgi:hypothetical protein